MVMLLLGTLDLRELLTNPVETCTVDQAQQGLSESPGDSSIGQGLVENELTAAEQALVMLLLNSTILLDYQC